jgi:expansin (peptidoglycan-binding protein)
VIAATKHYGHGVALKQTTLMPMLGSIHLLSLMLGCASTATPLTQEGTGGTAGDPTGGASAASHTGGSFAASTGTSSAATGGAASDPTDFPRDCGAAACNNAKLSNPQYSSYGALGNVTMYSTAASDGGACNYGSTSILYFAAINVNLSPNDGAGQWRNGSFCGQCLEVSVVTSQGVKAVVVRVMDKCADGYCGVDLGGDAPAAVMLDGMGRYAGAWRPVSCEGHPEVFDGTPSIYVKEGSNPGWAAVQVRNPLMAVAGIDWKGREGQPNEGSMQNMAPSLENYFRVPDAVLQSRSIFDLTVKYVSGATASIALTGEQLGQASQSYPLD